MINSLLVRRQYPSPSTHPQHILLSNLIIVLPTLDFLDIILKLLAHANSLVQVRVVQLGLAKASQLSRRGDRIADLSPVHRRSGQIFEVRSHVVEIDIFVQLCQAVDEFGPDLGSAVGVEVVEMQGELDAGFERFVECADTVTREDQDAYLSWLVSKERSWRLYEFTVVVLDHTEKDCRLSAM
jgi:hypothetical protein